LIPRFIRIFLRCRFPFPITEIAGIGGKKPFWRNYQSVKAAFGEPIAIWGLETLTIMKKLLVLFGIALLAASCDIDIVEPQYDPASKVTGRYWVEEYSRTFDMYTEYDIRIYQNGYGNVVITNFYGVDIDVTAQVRGNTLYIPFQVHQGYEIEGTATFSYGELRFNYTVRDTYDGPFVRDVCSAEAWIY
jgi:hypothetical protein